MTPETIKMIKTKLNRLIFSIRCSNTPDKDRMLLSVLNWKRALDSEDGLKSYIWDRVMISCNQLWKVVK